MMNDSTRVMRRPRRARPLATRTAAAIIAAATLAMLAAACSGSPSSTGPGGSSNARGPVSSQAASSKAVTFSHCMRSQGVPDFPDPFSRGGVPKVTPQQAGVSNSQFQVAERACAQLLQPTRPQILEIMTGMLNFARCMRSHGVPNWPDPMTDSQGRPVFDLGAAGITRSEARTPPVTTKVAECQHLLPSALGGNTPIGGS
jgi:hypothetical protein